MSDTILPEAKACNCCGVVKLLTEYRRKSRNKDGRFPMCKACQKARQTEAQREQARIRAKDWYRANPDIVRRRAREWGKANPEKLKASQRKNQASPAGRVWRQAWLDGRPGARRKWARKYYLKNKDRYLGYARTRRAKVVGAVGSHTKEDIAAIAKSQRMRCVYCKTSLKGGFHADHIMPLALGGSNDRTNIQLLCPRCNRSKGAKHPVQFAMQHGMLL